jgi:hypothetical protein
MRASQKVMAACIFSGQCANYGCLPLYHYETILNVMELSFIYIYIYIKLQSLFSFLPFFTAQAFITIWLYVHVRCYYFSLCIDLK